MIPIKARTSVVVLILTACIVALISVAQASTYVWKAETKSYLVYAQVVPAELVKHQPFLLDGKTQLHNVTINDMTGLSHVWVWVIPKTGNSKSLDVTVIAEIDSVAAGEIEKPLEKMKLSGSWVLGNIFRVHRDDKHSLTLKIYDADREGFEEAVFTHEVQ